MNRAPYKFLDYYKFEDADLFFGREEEVQRMIGEILSTRLLVLFSPSGSGKTSLINAGVRPELEKLGYRTVYSRFQNEPAASSVIGTIARDLGVDAPKNHNDLYEFFKSITKADDKSLVVFIDQFEEFFIVFRDIDMRRRFIDQIAKIKYDDQLPVFIVLSMREDYFVNLHEFREAIPSIFQNNANIRLEPFSEQEAHRAIQKPANVVDLTYEKDLIPKIIYDLKQQGNGSQGIDPIALQLVCYTIWQNKPEKTKTISKQLYEKCGGAGTFINKFLTDALNKVAVRKQRLMVKVFEALKTPENTKRFRSLPDLRDVLQIKERGKEGFTRLLNTLTELHILRHEQRQKVDWYEFKHDYLVPQINQWIENYRERVNKKRTRLFLTLAILMAVVAVASLVNYEINVREQLAAAIQLAQPEKNRVLIGNFRDERRIQLRVILDNRPELAGAAAFLNGAEMSFNEKGYRTAQISFLPDSLADSSKVAFQIKVDKGLRKVDRNFNLGLARFRRSSALLSDSAVDSMIVDFNFFDRLRNRSAGFTNAFEILQDSLAGVQQDSGVVVDSATGLMWQQAGYLDQLTFSDTQAYIDSLNAKEYGGYTDWRLPSLEEAMTLMEPVRKSGDLYIEPIFDQTQRWIWTADKRSASNVWVVHFSNGYCFNTLVIYYGYVRAVR